MATPSLSSLSSLSSVEPDIVEQFFKYIKDGKVEEVEEMLKEMLKRCVKLVHCSHPKTKATPLICAIEKGDIDIVQLLLNYNANIEQCEKKYNETPLCRASRKKDVDVLKLLLARNVDVNRTIGERGYTALHEAVAENNEQAVLLLLRHAAIKPSIQDSSGNTALHIAIEKNLPRIVSILFPRLDIDLKNESGLIADKVNSSGSVEAHQQHRKSLEIRRCHSMGSSGLSPSESEYLQSGDPPTESTTPKSSYSLPSESEYLPSGDLPREQSIPVNRIASSTPACGTTSTIRPAPYGTAVPFPRASESDADAYQEVTSPNSLQHAHIPSLQEGSPQVFHLASLLGEQTSLPTGTTPEDHTSQQVNTSHNTSLNTSLREGDISSDSLPSLDGKDVTPCVPSTPKKCVENEERVENEQRGNPQFSDERTATEAPSGGYVFNSPTAMGSLTPNPSASDHRKIILQGEEDEECSSCAATEVSTEEVCNEIPPHRQSRLEGTPQSLSKLHLKEEAQRSIAGDSEGLIGMKKKVDNAGSKLQQQ